MRKNQIIAFSLLALFALSMFGSYFFKSCSKQADVVTTDTPDEKLSLQKAPVFSADTAYQFIAKQVAFGPRIPATAPHMACATWLQNTLKNYGAVVVTQDFVGTAYDGKKRASKNIIGSFNPSAAKRILIAAHWDTRPMADKDTKDINLPIDGAIDGGSGVAVALEIARQIKNNPLKPELGVDFIFFDNEDNGVPENYTTADPNINYWCLGSQYWAANKHIPNYSAYFGILLDMVGAKGTYFAKEEYSKRYATSINDLVWNVANQIGYSNYFKNEDGGGVTDDHVPVNEVAKIPMIDIISNDGNGGFGAYHHTHADNLSNVSKENLKAVGQTVIQVIYNEQ
jgi:glutaminyl-peptide cyclotransferase